MTLTNRLYHVKSTRNDLQKKRKSKKKLNMLEMLKACLPQKPMPWLKLSAQPNHPEAPDNPKSKASQEVGLEAGFRIEERKEGQESFCRREEIPRGDGPAAGPLGEKVKYKQKKRKRREKDLDGSSRPRKGEGRDGRETIGIQSPKKAKEVNFESQKADQNSRKDAREQS